MLSINFNFFPLHVIWFECGFLSFSLLDFSLSVFIIIHPLFYLRTSLNSPHIKKRKYNLTPHYHEIVRVYQLQYYLTLSILILMSHLQKVLRKNGQRSLTLSQMINSVEVRNEMVFFFPSMFTFIWKYTFVYVKVE